MKIDFQSIDPVTKLSVVTSVVVEDNGPGDVSPELGVIHYGGTSGAWSMVVDLGLTKPAVGGPEVPDMDLSLFATSVGPGTIKVQFSDSGFGPTFSTVRTPIVGAVAAGAGNQITYSTLISPSNQKFTGDLLTSKLTSGPGAYSLQPGPASLNVQGPYALTQVIELKHTGASTQNSRGDAALLVAPTGSIGNFVWRDLNGNGIQEGGEPGIGGVAVKLETEYGEVVGTTVTDVNGFYRFDGLYANSYTVTVDLTSPSLAGLLPSPSQVAGSSLENDSNPIPSTVQLATSASTDQSIDFGFFKPTGRIGDFVWNDLDRNGVQDSGEPGLDGVTVRLKNGGNEIATVVTDSNGYYEFGGLARGTYTVEVDANTGALPDMLPSPGGGTTDTEKDSNGNSAMVSLPLDNSADLSIDFGFYGKPRGKIGDLVWKDKNQNGLQDLEEAGIPNVPVILKDGDGTVIATTLTDSAGKYLFENLFAGDYTVTVNTPSNMIPTFQEVGSDRGSDSNGSPAAVTLPLNTSVDLSVDLGFIPAPEGTIGDYVWLDSNGDGIQANPSVEPGIAGVTVHLYNAAHQLIGTETTDTTGYYLFTGLSKGEYTVEVPSTLVLGGYSHSLTTHEANGSSPANDSNPNPASVVLHYNDDSDTTIDFGYTPDPASRIGDFVWEDLNGNGVQDYGEPGIPGIKVTLFSQANVEIAETLTDANGAYLFANLRAGTYLVSVDSASLVTAGYLVSPIGVGGDSAKDSNPNPAAVTLFTNTEEDLKVDFGFLKPTGRIGNFVWRDLNENGIQDTGEPGISSVAVKLERKEVEDYLPAGSTTTDASGKYLFEGLSAGNYRVSVVSSSPPLTGLTPAELNAPSANQATDSNANPSSVTLPDHHSEDLTIDFGYIKPEGAIGDFVWKDLNGNGVQETGEPGIQGVKVVLYAAGDLAVPLATATTDANGAYVFYGLRAGSYLVKVDAANSPILAAYTPSPQGASNTAIDSNNPAGTAVTLPSAYSNLTIDFGYVPPPTGRIGDFVWNDLNRNGIQDAAEPGISGVTVGLNGGPTNVQLTTVTSGNGAYLFTGLKAGTYTVVVDGSQPALAGAGYSPTIITAGGSNPSNDSNGSPVTVTLPTNEASDLTIDFGFNLPPQVFTTYTMGGWGAKPSGNNPGTLLLKNFTKIYPKGLVIGGTYKLTFTSQLGIENFLPSGTTPRALAKSYTNPTTALGNLAGQVTALRLSVDFSNAGVLPTGLKNAVFNVGPFAGKTVGYVLTLAESVLGGGSLPNNLSCSDLSAACALVNENYDNGFNLGQMTP